MNDLWKLPGDQWVVYTSNVELLKEFSSMRTLKLMATYSGVIKRHRAKQFIFPHNEELLKYICELTGINYDNVFLLRKKPGVSYRQLFPEELYQPHLFVVKNYESKKNKAKKVKQHE